MKIVNRIIEPKEKKPIKKKKKIVRKKGSATPPPVGEIRKKYRPTVYSNKHIEYAEKYLDSCIDTERRRVKSESESIGGSSTSWEYGINVNIPTIEGLCVYFYDMGIGVNRETIYRWKGEKDKEAFSNILDKIMLVQANRLLKNGLNGDYNPTIAKMMLTKHGYVEKTENDTNLKGSLTLADGLIALTKTPQKEEK